MKLPVVLGVLFLLFFASARAHDFSDERLPVRLANGRTLEARLSVPVLRPGERVPAVMVFGGFQNAARVLDLVKPDRPVILASFDYPFSPPRRFVFPQSLRFAPEAKQMIHDSIEGVRALAERLSWHPAVDPGKVIVIGASLGAPFALAGAASAASIHGVVLVHGFGDVPKTIAHQLERAWQPKLRFMTAPIAGVFGFLSWSYLGIPSPEDSAKSLSAEQRVLVISAEQDSFIPREASDSLWSAVQSSRARSERIVMPGDHLQPGSDALISELMAKVWEWAGRVELVSPSVRL